MNFLQNVLWIQTTQIGRNAMKHPFNLKIVDYRSYHYIIHSLSPSWLYERYLNDSKW